MEKIMIVGLGGAAGAVGRYLFSLLPFKTAFPILTLLTNLLGSLLIGIVAGIFSGKEDRKSWLLFWQTGVCGGFTTFSTFSLEAWRLVSSGRYWLGILYILLSVSSCIAGVVLGLSLSGRFLLS